MKNSITSGMTEILWGGTFKECMYFSICCVSMVEEIGACRGRKFARSWIGSIWRTVESWTVDWGTRKFIFVCCWGWRKALNLILYINLLWREKKRGYIAEKKAKIRKKNTFISYFCESVVQKLLARHFLSATLKNRATETHCIHALVSRRSESARLRIYYASNDVNCSWLLEWWCGTDFVRSDYDL